MTPELIASLIGSGVLAQGFAAMMWAARMEVRVKALEVKYG